MNKLLGGDRHGLFKARAVHNPSSRLVCVWCFDLNNLAIELGLILQTPDHAILASTDNTPVSAVILVSSIPLVDPALFGAKVHALVLGDEKD